MAPEKASTRFVVNPEVEGFKIDKIEYRGRRTCNFADIAHPVDFQPFLRIFAEEILSVLGVIIRHMVCY